jgi:error-prone DNA polymerase
MVNPYLARRTGQQAVTCIHPALEPVLRRTLGVPLFQEQMLRIAMIMADFSGSEAEELRRALSFHRSHDRMDRVCLKLRDRMVEKGHAPEVIEEIAKTVQSFALYGFPESHAISFAILAYGSAWLKVHRAPEFLASLLNNQPMGFYSPATLVKDAQRHGVRTRHVCALRSDWDCSIEADGAVRLGFCIVRGLNRHRGERIVRERQLRVFVSLQDFVFRTALNKDELRTLAEIGALNCFADHRRDALWKVEKAVPQEDLFAAAAESASPLPAMNPDERIQADYQGTSLTTGPHHMALLRDRFPASLPLL